MKKYVLAFILGFGALMILPSCEDTSEEIVLQGEEKKKVVRPD